jgi:hypothetical protein
MSNGGTFATLESNTKSVERDNINAILMADRMVKSRLEKLRSAKAKKYAGADGVVPERDIDKTVPSWEELSRFNFVYPIAHYKPFVRMGFGFFKMVLDSSSYDFGSTVIAKYPLFGDFLTDTVLHVDLINLQAVDLNGRCLYCDYPGQKYVERTTLKLGSLVIDEYYDYDQVIFFNTEISNDRFSAYRRMMGQEVPKLAYLTLDPLADNWRIYHFIGDGAQTGKRTHGNMEMWIPMLFWFCVDQKNALPTFPIENAGDLTITMQIVERNEFVFGTGYQGASSDVTGPQVRIFELYSRQLFMNTDALDVLKERLGFQLIRTHRTKITTTTDSNIYINLNYFKYPIEEFSFMMVLRDYETTHDRWYRGTLLDPVEYRMAIALQPEVIGEASELGYSFAQSYNEVELFDRLTMNCNGVQLYYEVEPQFFNSYTPYAYGNDTIVPREKGFYVIPFNMQRFGHQPTGFLLPDGKPGNEIFLESSVVGVDLPAKVIASAKSINFLIFSKDSMTLRLTV